MRYQNFGNSKFRSFSDIKHLIFNDKALADFLYSNKDEFSAIRTVYNAKSLEDFYTQNISALSIITNNILELTNGLTDTTIKLYRGIVLGPDDIEPDLKDTGISWTYDYITAEKFVDNLTYDLSPDFAPCVLTAVFDIDQIDWLYSIACQLEEPAEKEIRIFKASKPLDIDYQVL